jgi:ribose 5-phosphate isomerase B
MKDGARAIVFGGTGLGECIAANKVKGARCATAYDAMTARKSREHNDANVLALGGRTVTKDTKLALRIVRTWLDTPFSGDARHKRRLAKIARYER